MSDLHAEAPQPSRAAPYVRTSRAAPHAAADITTAFDQIFANAAQPTQQAAPQVAAAIAATPVDVNYPAAVKPEDSRIDEDLAADEASAERHDAPCYEALPIGPEQRTHAERLDAAKPLAPPVALATAAAIETRQGSPAADRPPTQPAKQPRTTDPRRALTAEKLKPEAPSPSQNTATGITARAIPTATKRTAETRTAELRATVSRKIAPTDRATKLANDSAEPTVSELHATTVRRSALSREATPSTPQSSASTNAQAKVKVAPHPVAATTSAKPQPPISDVASAASGAVPRRAKAKSESKPTDTETLAGAGSAAPEKLVRREPAQTAKNPPESAAKSVDSTQASKQDVAEASAARVAKQQVSPALAAEVQPTQARDVGAKNDVRRARDARNAPIANAEGKIAETPQVVTSRTVEVVRPAIAPPALATNLAPSIPVAPAASAEPASAAKATAGNNHRTDQRATPAAATPAGALREAGTSLADTSKTTAPPRARTDQQQEVDRVRLVQRVAKALQTAQDRGAPLRLRLTPPELGVLRIELIVRDGALSAKLEAETPAAKTAILENLSALRERLTAQEIKIERFDVDLMQQPDNSGGERKSFADAEASREQAAARQFRNERATTRSTSEPAIRPAAVRHAPGQLNVLA